MYLLNLAATLSLVFILSTETLAQKPPMEFGEVPKHERAMTVYAPDSSADAAILYKYGEISIVEGGTSFEARIFTMKRIKILTEAGKEFGDYIIRFYHKNALENVKSIKAVIVQPDNTITKLDKKDIFEEKANEYFTNIRFSMPKVQVGSVIDIRYELWTKNIAQLKRWYFQENIPVAHSELKFNSPQYFSYQYFVRGYALGNVKALDNQEYPIDVKVNKGNFVLKNVPGMRREKYLSSLKNYKAHVVFQLEVIQYPNQLPEKYLATWDEFLVDFHEHRYQGDRYTKKLEYNKLWQAFEPQYDANESHAEKIQKAYKFVNSEIHWNGFISTSCSKTINLLYKEKKASTAGLSFAMIAILREMGYEAHPILGGVRTDGLLITDVPITDQFNHTMVYVEFDDQYMIIDMGNANRPLGILSLKSLNFFGLLVRKKVVEWVPIESTLSRNINLVNAQLNGSTISGTIKTKMTGYEALRINEDYKDGMEGYFKEVYPTGKLSNYESKNISLDHPDYKASFDFDLDLEVVDDLIFLYPVLYSEFKENPFQLNKRYFPVEFTHPFQEQFIFRLKIPEGYVVDELPQSKFITSPDKLIEHKFVVENKNGLLSVVSNLSVKKSYFPIETYQSLKEFFSSFAETATTPIVLKKL